MFEIVYVGNFEIHHEEGMRQDNEKIKTDKTGFPSVNNESTHINGRHVDLNRNSHLGVARWASIGLIASRFP